MSTFPAPSRPTWYAGLLADVDAAFEITGADAPGWPDPHPDRAPYDEEYSRVPDPGKYRILEARVDAWAAVLGARGIATVHVEPPSEAWIGDSRELSDLSRVRRIVPARDGGLALLIASTLVNGRPFGVEVGLAGRESPAVLLDLLPVCGCDACDEGSAQLVDALDDRFATVAIGGVVHARDADRSITQDLDGWEGSGQDLDERWLDESWPASAGVRRWVGQPWL